MNAEVAAEGTLDTALADFLRREPVVHWIFHGSESLRQVLAIGVHGAARTIAVRRDTFVCLETSSRRLYAYRYTGVPLRLEEGGLEELAALSDALYDAGFRGDSGLAIDYIDGVGCRIADCYVRFRDAVPLNWLQDIAHLPAGTCKGTFQAWSGAPMFGMLEWDEAIAAPLIRMFSAEYPEFDSPSEAQMKPLLAAVRRASEDFAEAIQQFPYDACCKVMQATIQDFNSFAHPLEDIARYRFQAANAIPILGFLCARRWEPDVLGIRLAIDRRQPLFEAAAKCYQIPSESIRFLSGKSLHDLGLLTHDYIAQLWVEWPGLLLKALAAMAPEHRPRGLQDWLAFYPLVEQFRTWEYVPSEVVEPFFREAGRRGLLATSAWLAAKHGSENAIADCQDFFFCLADALPPDERRTSPRAAILCFLGGKGPQQLLEWSKRWHRAVLRETASRLNELEAVKKEPPIPLPFAPPREIDGIQFVFLDRFSALVEEGLRMSHCVATLYHQSRTGRRLAFSVRAANGHSLASFDLTIERGASEVEIVLNELRGHRNAEPSAECKLAVTRFLAMVRDDLRAHPEAVDRWREELRTDRDRMIERRLGEVFEEAKRAACVVALGENEFERLVRWVGTQANSPASDFKYHRTVTNQDAARNALASYVVEDGKPGPQKI